MWEDGIDRVMPKYVRTYSGHQFFLEEPEKSEISLVDIAHGLSHICRFAGQVKKFYSVAEHSIYVADWVAEKTGDPVKAISALLHDASEAFLVDIPSPLKKLIPEYAVFEKRAMDAIFEKFRCEWCPEIHEADMKILVTEMRDLMHGSCDYSDIPAEPFNWTIKPMTPPEAKKTFLKTYLAYLMSLNEVEYKAMNRKLELEGQI